MSNVAAAARFANYLPAARGDVRKIERTDYIGKGREARGLPHRWNRAGNRKSRESLQLPPQ